MPRSTYDVDIVIDPTADSLTGLAEEWRRAQEE
jgi:hypothetical protein